MSDAPSQPIAPIPRTTRPMSEGLLNEKVHLEPLLLRCCIYCGELPSNTWRFNAQLLPP
jgi:hypothetical protein